MNKKRKHEDKEHLLRKIRKLEKKIQRLVSDDEESEVEEVVLPPVDEAAMTPSFSPVLEELDSPTKELFSATENLADEDDDPLDETILKILGTVQTEQKGSTLHKEIVSRWTEVIANGLKKEEKDEIIKNNLPFEDCPEICAPKLNPEVKAALPEPARKRDQVIENRQKQVSTVLSCLGSAMQGCISGSAHHEILERINNASRLLCDTFYLDSKGRRSLILFSINKDMKESLLQTKPQEYLFGNDLSEKIRTAKTVQKSVQDLKVPQKKNNTATCNTDTTVKGNTRTLNWRGPPRRGVRTQKPVAGGGPTYGGRLQTKKKDERPQERQPYRNTRR